MINRTSAAGRPVRPTDWLRPTDWNRPTDWARR